MYVYGYTLVGVILAVHIHTFAFRAFREGARNGSGGCPSMVIMMLQLNPAAPRSENKCQRPHQWLPPSSKPGIKQSSPTWPPKPNELVLS
jgi:hypothetical protein